MKQKYIDWQEYNNKLLELVTLSQDLRIEHRQLFYEFKKLSYEINNKKIIKDGILKEHSEDSYDIVWKNDSMALPKAERELLHIEQEMRIVEEVILSIHRLQDEIAYSINNNDFYSEEVNVKHEQIISGEKRVDLSMDISNNKSAIPDFNQEDLMDDMEFEDFAYMENIGWFEDLNDNNT